jgi:nucleoside triphosphate pyrophosphatase
MPGTLAGLWTVFRATGITDIAGRGRGEDVAAVPAATTTAWKTPPMLILASRSPARRNLLAGVGLSFDCEAAEIDERGLEDALRARGASAVDIAKGLAGAKAEDVARRHPDAVVIGADQVLVLGDDLLHKPADVAAARAQLDRLRGRTHRLHAGVALVIGRRLAWDHVESADLTMRGFSNAERDAILAAEGEAILGSVGGYRLEGPSVRLFESVHGDYFTILGLPLLALLGALRRFAPDELGRVAS